MTASRTAGARGAPEPIGEALRPSDDPSLVLVFAADALDRAEGMRIAMTNRLRAMIQSLHYPDETSKKLSKHVTAAINARLQGLVAGKMLTDIRAEMELAALIADASSIEDRCTKMVQRAMREQPLGPWVKRQKGLGDKQMGRLLAALGDPYVRRDGQPRTIGQLWSYCGVGDAAKQKRAKGVRSNWNATAKMRAHLVAESCLKQPVGTRYRDVYVATKVKYENAPIIQGHKHNRALRKVAKEVLRDLWIESKRLHEMDASGQAGSDYPRIGRQGVRLALVG